MKRKKFNPLIGAVAAFAALPMTSALAVTIELNQRPGGASSSFTIDGGAAITATTVTCNYDGDNSSAGTGAMVVTADGVDLIGDGKTYDIVLTYPISGANVVYNAGSTRLELGAGDELTFGAGTITVYEAGTQTPAPLQQSFTGYVQTVFSSNNSSDTTIFSGSGIETFSNTSDDNPSYSATTDLILQKTNGSNNLTGQVARFFVDGALPQGISTLAATTNAASGIDLSWSSVAGATSYALYRGTSDDSSSASKIQEGLTDLTFTDTNGLIDDLTYYYWVVANNQYGGSGFSASATSQAVIAAPEASDGFVFEVRGGAGRARVLSAQDELESVLKSREDLHAEKEFILPGGYPDQLESIVPLKMADGINGFAIITTEEYKNRLTKLDDYIAHKTNRGFRMMVITEKDYDPQGETTVGQPRAWKIREWLHNNYESEKLLYVMFIGNPKPNYGDVPMFLCRGNTPSDYAYADCSGATWDLNGNGRYGDNWNSSHGSDYGEGGADYYPDVWVGRMMIYGDHHEWATCADMDFLLQRNIDWENDEGDLSWRQDVLCGNVGNVGPARYSTIQNHAAKYVGAEVKWMMEDWGNYVPSTGLTGGVNVVNAHNERPYGILHYHGHGTPSSIIGTIATHNLPNITQPKVAGFGYAGGCTIAHPNREDNITWALVRYATMGYCGATQVISSLDGTNNGRNGLAYVAPLYGGQSNGEVFWRGYGRAAVHPRGHNGKMGHGNIKMSYYGDPSAVLCPQRRGRPLVLTPNALVEINHQYGVTDKAEVFEYHMKNNTDATANFTSSTTESWLTVTPSSFTLGPNETMTLTISCDSMGSLPVGANTASFDLNSDQGHSVTREVVANHYLPHELLHENCDVVNDATKETTEVASAGGVFGTNGIHTYGDKAKFKKSAKEVRRQNYAISCWMNVSKASDGVILSRTDVWDFGLQGGKFTFTVYQNLFALDDTRYVGTTIQDPTVLNLNQWYHLVLNIDTENHMISAHVNGVEVAQAPLPYEQLGSGHSGGQISFSPDGGKFDVSVDDVWILRKYADQDDIDALSRGGFARVKSPARNGVTSDAAQTLNWNANAQAVSYNVYHGSDLASVMSADTNASEFVGNTSATNQAVTSISGQNYWRVDVVTSTGTNKGFVWNYNYDTNFTNSEPVWGDVDIVDWQVGDDGPTYILTNWVTDEDEDAVLSFELIDGPDWFVLGPDGSLGSPFGPAAGDVGVNTVEVKVTDQWGANATTTFTINVIN